VTSSLRIGAGGARSLPIALAPPERELSSTPEDFDSESPRRTYPSPQPDGGTNRPTNTPLFSETAPSRRAARGDGPLAETGQDQVTVSPKSEMVFRSTVDGALLALDSHAEGPYFCEGVVPLVRSLVPGWTSLSRRLLGNRLFFILCNRRGILPDRSVLNTLVPASTPRPSPRKARSGFAAGFEGGANPPPRRARRLSVPTPEPPAPPGSRRIPTEGPHVVRTYPPDYKDGPVDVRDKALPLPGAVNARNWPSTEVLLQLPGQGGPVSARLCELVRPTQIAAGSYRDAYPSPATRPPDKALGSPSSFHCLPTALTDRGSLPGRRMTGPRSVVRPNYGRPEETFKPLDRLGASTVKGQYRPGRAYGRIFFPGAPQVRKFPEAGAKASLNLFPTRPQRDGLRPRRRPLSPAARLVPRPGPAPSSAGASSFPLLAQGPRTPDGRMGPPSGSKQGGPSGSPNRPEPKRVHLVREDVPLAGPPARPAKNPCPGPWGPQHPRSRPGRRRPGPLVRDDYRPASPRCDQLYDAAKPSGRPMGGPERSRGWQGGPSARIPRPARGAAESIFFPGEPRLDTRSGPDLERGSPRSRGPRSSPPDGG